jgi:hypothetical protein
LLEKALRDDQRVRSITAGETGLCMLSFLAACAIAAPGNSAVLVASAS